jgi:GT2 family glycosyltransferase
LSPEKNGAVLQIAVIIASVGRRDLLSRTVTLLGRQTRRADRVIVCGASAEDTDGVAEAAGFPVEVITAPKGLPRQRNAGLRHLAQRGEGVLPTEIVVFFDDDFVPAHDYLEVLEKQFAARPNLVGATAVLLADGIKSPGISLEDAVAMIEARRPPELINERALPALYGCNLCIRLSAAEGLWFDEALPLYGWQEDVDFSYQLGRKGILVYTNQLAGVHLGAKGGRTSGKRLGYSQIANPIYLLRKKTIPRRLAWRLMSRNVLANCARSIWPEPYVDRFGRLHGNVEALIDLARGRIHPERILQL